MTTLFTVFGRYGREGHGAGFDAERMGKVMAGYWQAAPGGFDLRTERGVFAGSENECGSGQTL